MAPLRVFISYSAKHDDEGKLMLKDLVHALNTAMDEKGEPLFVPLVDEDISSADEWRPILYGWMMTADAAVILLDKSLPDSKWVPREAAILCSRQMVEKKFKILPVLRNVGIETLQNPPLDGLDVSKWQAISFKSEVQPIDVQVIVNKLKENVISSSNLRVTRLVAKLIAYELQLQVFVDERFSLLPPKSYRRGWKLVEESAAALLSHGLRKDAASGNTYPSARLIRELCLAVGNRDLAQRLRENLNSYWVDRAASARLFLLRGDERPIVIGLRLNDAEWMDRAVLDYLSLAYSETDDLFLLTNVPVEDAQLGMTADLDRLTRNLKKAVARKLKDSEDWNSEVESFYMDPEEDLYCWLSLANVRMDDFIKLQSSFDRLKLIGICCDATLRSDTRVNYLSPDIEPDAEATARRETEYSIRIMEPNRL